MNWKILLTVFVTGILTFAMGLYSHDMNYFAKGVIVDRNRIDSLQRINPKTIAISQGQLDSLIILSNSKNDTINFSKRITGRFVLKGAKFAGFNFYSPTRITWINEMDAGHPDTLKIRWINNATFFTRDITRINETCPPRVWIYQVISFDRNKLILKDIWTGWNDFKDERLEFVKNDKVDRN